MCQYLMRLLFCAMPAAHAVNVTFYIISPQTKTEPPKKRARSMTHASTAVISFVSVDMANVKPTFIRKQNQIPFSTSEVEVTAAPIPPCRSMTKGENLTEVRSVSTKRLNGLCQPMSYSLWMDTILSSGCCCSQTPVT